MLPILIILYFFGGLASFIFLVIQYLRFAIRRQRQIMDAIYSLGQGSATQVNEWLLCSLITGDRPAYT